MNARLPNGTLTPVSIPKGATAGQILPVRNDAVAAPSASGAASRGASAAEVRAEVKLTFLSLKLTFLSLKLTFLQEKRRAIEERSYDANDDDLDQLMSKAL